MKIYEICFSPTGGTKKVSDFLTESMEGDTVFVDLLEKNYDFSSIKPTCNDIAFISVPSFAGRVPKTAVERLSKIQSDGALAVLVCVYGNRAYEDTLAELYDTAKQSGFKIIAAVAAVAEHSIARQFAKGRPDAQDYDRLSEFSKQIKDKINSENICEITVPGNRPYKKTSASGMIPKPTNECTGCGVCAEKCPVGAIDLKNPKKVNADICISCMRCADVCPQSARKLNAVMLSAVGLALKKVCSDRKNCELFI